VDECKPLVIGMPFNPTADSHRPEQVVGSPGISQMLRLTRLKLMDDKDPVRRCRLTLSNPL